MAGTSRAEYAERRIPLPPAHSPPAMTDGKAERSAHGTMSFGATQGCGPAGQIRVDSRASPDASE